jgi:hypothetical protein
LHAPYRRIAETAFPKKFLKTFQKITKNLDALPGEEHNDTMPKTKTPGMWNPDPQPIEPNAKKKTGRANPKSTHQSRSRSQRGLSQERTTAYQDEDASFELTTQEGKDAYDLLIATAPEVDLTQIRHIEERIPGDRDKLVQVLQNLALGARHREALDQVGWTWSHFTIYRSRYPLFVGDLYNKVQRIGEEMRKVTRLDEAHRRATEGSEEQIFSPSGRLVGTRIKYSDALLSMFLKADHPEKFAERVKVESTGVVLNMHMGLRENVRTTAMQQGDIEITSPFAE